MHAQGLWRDRPVTLLSYLFCEWQNERLVCSEQHWFCKFWRLLFTFDLRTLVPNLRMVRWCIRLTRLTLVCEVIRYRLVQVQQNLKKRLSGWRPAITFLYLFLFPSLLRLSSFLSQYKKSSVIKWRSGQRTQSKNTISVLRFTYSVFSQVSGRIFDGKVVSWFEPSDLYIKK